MGSWFGFGSTDINRTFAVSVPGSSWHDQSCAAWLIGGLPTGATATASDYAGIGVQLDGLAAYDLSAYSGARIKIESGGSVWFWVETADGGYFGSLLASTSGAEYRSISFGSLSPRADSAVSTLNLRNATAFQFTVPPESLAGFGFAVHLVELVK
jgi:hypothetical protein